MTRVVTFSLAVVIGLGAGVCLGIEQTQETQVETSDHILLQLGSQAADAVSNLAIFTEQLIDGACGQSLLVDAGAVGHASSDGAQMGVLRSLGIAGWQGQIITGPNSAKREDQTLGLQGLLSLGMANGPGEASGSQQFVIREDQGGGNFLGTMGSVTSVLGLQSTSLGGMTRPLDGAETRMQVDTVQNQLTP
ncbi:MAG: hypothetical protein JW955_21060 [Sedimentisphaerales bacterium]|nr:hypothetical protein [Sedimentisphaerales bacterium]